MIFLRYSGCPWVILIVLLLPVTFTEAGEWDITPRISVAEIYSDNIYLDDDRKEDDLVTDITPGISIRGEGARVRANLDYQMQNAIFLKNSGSTSTFQQLNADGTVEVARDLFFVDATSRMGQAVVSANDTISTGNLNRAGNRTDFYTYGLSPFILPRFGSFADGNARYTYESINYDEGGFDAELNLFEAGLDSGRFWGPLSWSGNYSNSDLRRDSSTDDKRESTRGDARYQVNTRFSLVAQGGYENNDYRSSQVIFNGSYWAAGFLLRPSRFYSLEALTGNNLTTVTVSLYPTSRTALVVNYRDQEVGTNTGEVWSGSFSHRTRRTSWNATYLEDTSTRQGAQLEQGFVFLSVDPDTGEVNPDPQPGDLGVIQPIGSVVSLTNETYERKRAFGSVGLRTGRTGLLFIVFDETRKYLSSLREEDVKGFSGSINRRLASRTNLDLTGSWQRISTSSPNTFNGTASDRDFWFIQTRLGRQLGRRLDGSVSYRFSKQESNGSQRSYGENRIEARLTATF